MAVFNEQSRPDDEALECLPMNRRNYARELDRIMLKLNGTRPKLLLHACCGPCSTSVLEFLSEHFDITILWYNPNLYPENEFAKRLDTLKEVLEKMNLSDRIEVLELPRHHEGFLSAVTGLENEPEGGARCAACFRLRLAETARIAAERHYDFFCTTLSVSRHKDAVLINAIGESAASEFGAVWLPSDFKKRNGENRSAELSEQLGIYRQLYCGCEYSLAAREKGEPV